MQQQAPRPAVGSPLFQRLRRWPNREPTAAQRLVFAVIKRDRSVGITSTEMDYCPRGYTRESCRGSVDRGYARPISQTSR